VATASAPSLYQINIRAWLTERSRHLGRSAKLDDITDDDLDCLLRWASIGSGSWASADRPCGTGDLASQSRMAPRVRGDAADLKDEDIGGSGFAIQSYTVHRDLGGCAALAGLRAERS
jgi:hypothetical protein